MHDSGKSTGDNKISVVHITSGDLWAGAEVQLYHLAIAQHRHEDINVFVILLNHGLLEECLRAGGIDVVVFDENQLNSVQIYLRILGRLRRINPDIVHTHRMKENILGAFASVFVMKTQSIRTVHGAQEFALKSCQIHKLAFRIIDKFCARFLQKRIILVSQELVESLKHEFPAKKLQVIENGITIAGLQAAQKLTAALPGPADTIRVAIAARLVPVKRLDLFLQAASLLIRKNPTVYSFYILGDGPLLNDMKGLAKQLNINQHVFFMGFQLRVLDYLSQMHLLLITSDHEGLPMNLLEALSLELPVIAHGVGGINQVLDQGKYGTIVRTHNAEAYAGAIRNYRADPERARKMAHQGRLMLEKRYSVARSVLDYHHLYTQLRRKQGL